MYRVERWDLKPCELGDFECVKTELSSWDTWEEGLEGFVRALSESVNAGGVVASSVHLGVTTASAQVSDTWSGQEWELVLALA